MQEIFAPLNTALHAEQYSIVDLLDVIGGFALEPGQHNIAAALALHSRDYLEENPGKTLEGSSVMSEAYRRTFFDAEKSAIYGTDEVIKLGPVAVKSFVAFLIDGLQADREHGAGASNYSSTSHH